MRSDDTDPRNQDSLGLGCLLPVEGTGRTPLNLWDSRSEPDHTAHPRFQRTSQLGKTLVALTKKLPRTSAYLEYVHLQI